MANEEKINELFDTLRNGTDQEKAEVREFIRHRDNQHLLYNPAFVQAAVANADLFGIPGMTLEEEEAYDAALEAEETCPCCGQRVEVG